MYIPYIVYTSSINKHSGCLWITPLWISVYKYLFQDLFQLGGLLYLGVELLSHTLILCLTCWGAAHKGVCHFILPPMMHQGFSFFKSMPIYLSPIFCIIATVVGISWFLTMVFICIFLITSGGEHLSSSSWPFVYPL